MVLGSRVNLLGQQRAPAPVPALHRPRLRDHGRDRARGSRSTTRSAARRCSGTPAIHAPSSRRRSSPAGSSTSSCWRGPSTGEPTRAATRTFGRRVRTAARHVARHRGVANPSRNTWSAPLAIWRGFARHTAASRFRRGRGGLTDPGRQPGRRVLTCYASTGHGCRQAAPRDVVATIPTFGVFVLWTRLRNWISGPVSYEVTGADETATSVGYPTWCRVTSSCSACGSPT